MHLRRTGAAVGFAALFIAVVAVFAMSPSALKSSAAETSIEESVRALAGAFSMLAQDFRTMRERSDADRADEIISRQQLTEAIERLTAQIEKKP